MNADLGARLLAAGLVTREELGRALASVPAHGGALAAELVRGGVEEEALLGFFVADGFGPVVDPKELENAEGDERVPPQLAVDMLALPLRTSASGLHVAMADPSDVHAVRELRQKTGVAILPMVAPVRALTSVLDARFPDEWAAARERRQDPDQAAPIALVRRRDTPAGGSIQDSFDSVVPLTNVAEKPPSGFPMQAEVEPRKRRRDTADFALPREYLEDEDLTRDTIVDELEREEGDVGRDTLESMGVALRQSVPNEGGGWGDLSESSPVDNIARRAARAHSILPQRLPSAGRALLSWESGPREAGDLSANLATIRAAKTKDEVVRQACMGLAPLGRCALILVLSKGILKGREVVGGDLPRDAVLNLWIPSTTRSLLSRVLETREPYLGPHGGSSADAVFRAALGSRGGDVLLVPVVLSGKTIAVLALDEPVADAVVLLERAEVVARATADAFRRLIAARKSPSRS
jgi:hypothetical protein